MIPHSVPSPRPPPSSHDSGCTLRGCVSCEVSASAFALRMPPSRIFKLAPARQRLLSLGVEKNVSFISLACGRLKYPDLYSVEKLGPIPSACAFRIRWLSPPAAPLHPAARAVRGRTGIGEPGRVGRHGRTTARDLGPDLHRVGFSPVR